MPWILLALLLIGTPPASAQPAPAAFDVVVTGHGRPILLIPGLASTGEVWASTVERYKDRHALHVLTLAGFGGPAPVGTPFLPSVRDAIVRYIRDAKLERPILIGHSLGAFVAFSVAAAEPEIVGGVIAVDGVPFIPALSDPAATPASAAGMAAQVRSMYAGLSREQSVAQSRLALETMITSPADRERALGWSAKADPATIGTAVAEMMTTDLREPIRAVTAPMLLIGALGAAPQALHDHFRSAYQSQMARATHARVVMATAARHFVMLDDPGFFFATVDGFLAAEAR
jgi:pimeloyl-ACP methyl ester carboxylesterase